jgi:hypothetical protein
MAVSPADGEWMSCSAIAARFGVNAELLRQRLSRLRERDDTSFIEVADRKVGEPQYLFRLSAVIPILQGMGAEVPGTDIPAVGG